MRISGDSSHPFYQSLPLIREWPLCMPLIAFAAESWLCGVIVGLGADPELSRISAAERLTLLALDTTIASKKLQRHNALSKKRHDHFGL